MELKIKICGMREQGNIREISGLHPEYMGFIFYPGSKRYAGRLSPLAVKGLPARITRVAVFVNASSEEIKTTCRAYSIRTLQLHGDETPDFCQDLRETGFKVIKAFPVGKSLDVAKMETYKNSADFLLLDTSADGFGGTGKKFDWRQLKKYDSELPFFLSGGIGPDDAEQIRKINVPQLYAVDLNSRFEIRPGLKNVVELENFIRKIRS